MNDRYTATQLPQVLGQSQTGEAVEDLGSILTNFSNRAVAQARPALLAEAERQGQNAGIAGKGEMRSTFTAFGRAFNQGVLAGDMAQRRSELRAGLAKIAAEHPGYSVDDITAFEQKSASLFSGLTAGIPEDNRPAFESEFTERRQVALARVQGNVLTRQRKLYLEQIGAKMTEDFEDAAVAARDNDIERMGALADSYRQQQATLVEIGELTPELAASNYEEFTQALEAEGIFGEFLRDGAPQGTLEQLVSGDLGGDLSLKQRDALAGKMRAEISRRETERRQALAEASIRQTQNSKAARVLIAKNKAGVPLDETEQQMQAAFLQTPGMIDPDVAANLSISNVVSAASQAMRRETPGNAQAFIAEMDAQGPPKSLEEAAIRKELRSVADEHAAAAKGDDFYAYLVEHQQAQPVQIDTSSPDGFAATIQGAAARGQVVSQQYGTRISPITTQQGRDIERMLDGLDVGGRAQVLGAIVSEFGADADLVLDRIGQEETSYSMAGSMMAFGDNQAAERILQATATIQAYAGEGKVLPEPDWKKSDIEAAEVGTSWFSTVRLADALPDPVVRSAVVSSAHDLMTYAKVRNKSLSISEALEQVGVSFGEYRDSAIVRPVGVSDAEFVDRMEALTGADIEAMGGVATYPPDEVVEMIQSGVAELKTLVPGIYEVRVGSTVLTRPDGAPFQLKVR